MHCGKISEPYKRPKLRRKSAETGQALIEMALTLPLLFALLIGVAEFGRLAYLAIEVANSAHAGAQYGAQSNGTASDSGGIQTAVTNDAPVSNPSTSSSTYCTCTTGGSHVACSLSSCANNRIVEYVQVNTSASVSPMFKYPGLSRSLTLTGQATMRVEQ